MLDRPEGVRDLHLAAHVHGDPAGRAHLLRPRHERAGRDGPVPRVLRVDERGRHPAVDRPARDADRPERQRERPLRVHRHRQRARRRGRGRPAHLRVQPRQRGWDECFSPKIYTGLTPGFHTFQVRALDDAGNFDPTPAGYSWEILDGTPPETNIDDGPDTPTTETTATLEFSSPTAGATFECALDAGAFDTCESPLELIGVGVGDHVFRVRAKSPAGLVDDTPAAHTWSVEEPPDTTAPETLILEGPDNTTPFTTAALHVLHRAGRDARVQARRGRLDAVPDERVLRQPPARPAHPARPREGRRGQHRPDAGDLELDDQRAAGHDDHDDRPEHGRRRRHGEHRRRDQLHLRRSRGDVPVLPRHRRRSLGRLHVAVPADRPHAWARTSSSSPPSGPEGTSIRPRPSTRGTSATPRRPASRSRAGPPPASTDTTPTFEFVSDDPEAVFQCSLDGGLPVVCVSGKTYTPEPARGRQRQRRRRPHLHRHGAQAAPARRSDGGRVAVRGRGSHRAGDRVPDAAARADVDQPARGLRLPHQRARREHRVLARRRAVHRAAQTQPDLLAEISADLPGEHTLRARAIDPSGNFDATPLSHTWTVVGEPVVTISDGPGDASGAEIVAEIPDTGATFTFASDQPGVSTLYCSLDGAEPAPCTSPVTYTPAQLAGLEPTPEGSHEFTVYATNDEFVNPADPLTVELPPRGRGSHLRVVDRPAARHAGPDRHRPGGPGQHGDEHHRGLPLLGNRQPDAGPRPHLRVLAGRRPLRGLLLRHRRAVHPHRAHRHLAHARHPRDRRDRERRPVRAPLVDDHRGAGEHASRATASRSTSATWTSPSRRSSTDGATTVSELTLAPAVLPEGYFEAGSRYYDISTTALYEAPVEVCINYNTLFIAEPVRLLHFDGSAWIDISTSSSAGPGLRPGRPPVAVRDRDRLGAGRAGDRHRQRLRLPRRSTPRRSSRSTRTTRSRPSSATSTRASRTARGRPASRRTSWWTSCPASTRCRSGRRTRPACSTRRPPPPLDDRPGARHGDHQRIRRRRLRTAPRPSGSPRRCRTSPTSARSTRWSRTSSSCRAPRRRPTPT